MFISNLLPDSTIKPYLDMLAYSNWRKFEPFTIIISAHPDDETIGMGSRIKKLSNAVFVYITNGAPSNPYYYQKAGYHNNLAYAQERKEELFKALSLSGFSSSDCIFLDIPDQESSFNMSDIVNELTSIFSSHEPDMIVTHPYEGGHPDHDTTALAVHMALQNNLLKNGYAPVALEFASYYAENGEFVTNRFLDHGECMQRDVVLTEEEQRDKVKMINCFVTQLEFLRKFSTEVELFRQIPDYDFTKPPHQGKLFYEQFDWGITGEKWRENACKVLDQFGFLEK